MVLGAHHYDTIKKEVCKAKTEKSRDNGFFCFKVPLPGT